MLFSNNFEIVCIYTAYVGDTGKITVMCYQSNNDFESFQWLLAMQTRDLMTKSFIRIRIGIGGLCVFVICFVFLRLFWGSHTLTSEMKKWNLYRDKNAASKNQRMLKIWWNLFISIALLCCCCYCWFFCSLHCSSIHE